MEKTNTATPANKTQELVENFFDAFDHTSVLVLIEQMGVEELHEVQELEPG